MKTFSHLQDFDCPLELLLQARQLRYKNPDRFYPELKNTRVLSRKEEGTKIFEERQFSIGAKLPESIASFLPSSIDKINEKSVFDTEKQRHSFEITSSDPSSQNLFHIKGESECRSSGAEHCQREYNVEVTSKAFLIGALIEGFIADFYLKKLEKDRESMLQSVAALREEKSGEEPFEKGEETKPEQKDEPNS